MRVIFWTIFLFLLWIVLSGSLSLENILVGAIVSGGVAIFYSMLFEGDGDGSDSDWIRPIGLMEYLYVLIKSLIISNLQINRRILSRKMDIAPAIVAIKTTLDSDWKKLLLANSITLTPGTLTLDIKDDILYIHVINYQAGMDKHDIIKEFEQVISKI